MEMKVPLHVSTGLWTLLLHLALCSTFGIFDQSDAAITLDPRTTSTRLDSSTQATPAPHELRQRQEPYTGITSYAGSVSVINTVGSVCGFVTSDIHWPLYCGTSQYCYTSNQYLECCTSKSTWSVTSTQLETLTSTVRNSYTTTLVSTYLNTNEYRYQLYGCGGYTACYNSTAASKCTGSCTSTAVMCTYEDAPYCASVYLETYISDESTSGTTGIATSWFCDTAAYGLTYGDWGYWPSRLSTYTTTFNNTYSTTKPTWTPSVVPFSQTQASRPTSAPTVPTPTSTSSASNDKQRSKWFCMLLSRTGLLIGVFFLL